MSGNAIGAPRIALLEDDKRLRESLRSGLVEEGFSVIAAATGTEFIDMLRTSDRPDVLIIDIGLPDADGRDVAMAVAGSGIAVPVLFLTAVDTLSDRLAAFSSGGDDYVTKPFMFDELVARLRALARRHTPSPGLVLGDASLDPAALTIGNTQVTVRLTPIEFRILATLASATGVTRRKELVRAGWPAGSYVSDNTLDSFVGRVRRKLREVDGAPSIVTVHGVGYKIE